MKLFILFLWLIALTYCCSAQVTATNPVKTANTLNKQTVKQHQIAAKEDADFLVKSAHARMTDMQ